MKILAALALLLVLGTSSAKAQPGSPPPLPDDRKVQIELLELQQDVDKTLLREALMIQGRRELRPLSERPTAEGAKNRDEADVANLARFIESKTEAITKRSGEISKLKTMPNRVANAQPGSANPHAVSAQDRQALLARFSEAEIELQMLQRKNDLFQQSLNETVEALARAELAASTDESKQKDIESASQRYQQAKARSLEISKKLLTIESDISSMRQQGGLAGLGGMGGGFR